PARATRAAAAAPAAEPVAAEPAPVEATTFDLQVTSVPMGAAVFIDGEPAGKTPNARRRLPAGAHLVRVELDGETAEREVAVSADSAPAVRYDFKEKTWRSIR
ncbi:MAG: PEGA domain-containing protein, partial [Myxococcota bacterium]